jgi:hypothetical protein
MPENDDAGNDDGGPGGENSGESRKERVDRELLELLNELRVALPGVQVLFAFLLTVPFSQRFGDATGFQRNAYFVTLVAAAVSTGLLIAPAAQHRALFRKRDKEGLLKRSNGYAIAGLVALAVAIVTSVVLVVDFIFGRTQALVTGGAVAVLLGWWWVTSPLLHRRRGAMETD